MVKTYLQHKFGGYLLEANAGIRTALSRDVPAKRKFVLFGRGRSGSTLLQTMLDSHSKIDCQGEILRYRTLQPLPYVQNTMHRSTAPVRGFKLLSYQLRDLCSTKNQFRFRDWLEINNVSVVHLQRTNLFRHALSNLYARQRQAYHSTDKKAEAHATIHIDVDELINWMEGSKTLLDYELEFLDGLPRHEVIYENDLATPEAQTATYNAITKSLGLEPEPIQVQLKKITPKDLSQIATNHEEIHARLKKTEYGIFLE